MANPIEYIVYEPDQVLTNDHLNETFNYLDQQNRWTRNKLIGIGIVCGLDIVLNPGVIGVTKGCGVTSQGYLIIQDAAQYTRYIPYAPVGVPSDLPFTYPYGDLPFYKPYCTGKKIWLLLTDDQYEALEPAQQPSAEVISSATQGFLQDYAVVLFLEANETDLKNCSMQDCNNKGEKMAFVVRPLLVPKKDLPTAKPKTAVGTAVQPINQHLPHEINFKRYNVPYTDLNNSDDVLNAFVKIVDDATLTQVSNAYNYCYQTYFSILKATTNPFTGMLAILQKYRTEILSKDPIFIEYYYDFIDDLIKAFYEFSAKVSGVISTCCPDENLFPLHLVLGGASSATNSLVLDNYRTYFIYSPLFSKMGSESAEVVLLFNRMVIMLNQFSITLSTVQNQFGEVALRQRVNIKITPSQYEFAWLSERAIPYYYNVNVTGSELYKAWNYYKTSRGNADFNLGYNSGEYNTNTAVAEPLLYDIEHYNFFRIEGHIGINFQTVLSNIVSQRKYYNLPFDVVPISADLLSGTATLPQCNFLDLETDYKLILSEAACKIHTIFCFVSKLPFRLARVVGVESGVFEMPKTGAMKFTAFRLQVGTVDEIVLSSALNYKKGAFMKTYCAPAANATTIGSVYLASLKLGVFSNPVQINHGDSISGAYFYLFEFIDAVEELMYVLHTSTVADIDMVAFETKYKNYLLYVGRTIEILTLLEEKAAVSKTDPAHANFITLVEATELDLLIEEMAALTGMCIDERLQVLKNEYIRRLNLYQQQHSFLNYYKNHPGLEHKAGVPKGGTLVLVYHSVQDTLSTNSGATFTRDPVLMEAPVLVKGTASSVTLDKSTVELLKSFVDDCKDAPPDKKRKLIDILSFRPPVQRKFDIPDGVVIADFYIPYLCCSDCPPTAYILPETTPPPTKDRPTIKMGDTFCDSVQTVKIGVSEPGGTFNKVPGLDGPNFTFSPAAAGAGHYNIVYTSASTGLSSLPFPVAVLATPANTFTFTQGFGTKETPQATFTADAQDAGLTYNWQFGPGFSPAQATTPTVLVDIQMNPTGALTDTTVSLQVSNGNCDNDPVVEQFTIGPNGLNQTHQPNHEGIISEIENFFKKKKKK